MIKAKAVVALAPRVVRVQRLDVPDPGPEEVVVRVQHSWISNGTEGSFVRGERLAGDTPLREGDPSLFRWSQGTRRSASSSVWGQK